MLSKVGERPKAGRGCSLSGAARFLGPPSLGTVLALVGGCDMEVLPFALLVFDDAAVWVVAVVVVVVVVAVAVVLPDDFLPLSSVGESIVSGGCDWRYCTMFAERLSLEHWWPTRRLCAATPGYGILKC